MVSEYINKLIIDGTTKFDISNDTVSASNLALGITAHDASGSTITGTLNIVSPTIVEKTSTDTEYILTVTDVNGSYDTPNLQGQDGADGLTTAVMVNDTTYQHVDGTIDLGALVTPTQLATAITEAISDSWEGAY